MKPHKNGLLSLLLFLALVLGGGLVIGMVTGPGAWYAALNKPAFTPPGWVFGPAWTLLYILIAIAGWRLWRQGSGGLPMALWWVQLALNFLWSPLFFSAQRIDLAFLVVVLLLVTILAFIAVTWRQERLAALLFLPYAAWVAYATLLNGAIWRLN